jgi:hypothetical protein
MYHESNDRRIDEKIENGKLVKELCDEKTKLQKKYQNLLEEVHNWMDSTERQVQIQNYARIMHDRPEMKQNNEDSKLKLMEILKNQFEKDLAEMEIQRNKLQDELVSFKKEQVANLELMQFRENKCAEEREALRGEREAVRVEWLAVKEEKDAMKKEVDGLKEEKKKLEYMIYDLLKAGEARKEKFRQIKSICDDELKK